MKTKPEIYTKEFVLKEVKSILAVVKKNKKVLYLGELLENKKYSKQRYSEWRKKFGEDKEISDTMGKVKDILETRINVGALKNKVSVTMAIFNLKNNYGWVDKQEFKHTGKVFITNLIKEATNGNNEPANKESSGKDKE